MNTRFFFVIEFLAKKPMHNPTDTSHSTNTTQAIYLTFNVFAMHVMAQAIANWNKTRDVKPRKMRNRFIACKIISKNRTPYSSHPLLPPVFQKAKDNLPARDFKHQIPFKTSWHVVI
ncbi:MAG: hypothetical protein ACOX5G_12325 [Kiritimatiellia bacterium]|jgi:hypothetical protein